MKNIHYAGDELLTGDAIADALVTYAETLARHETSASIQIPVLTASGAATEANFLLGPASQIVAVTVESDFADPDDHDLLIRMEAECKRLDGAEGRPTEDHDPQLDFDF